MSIIFLLMFVSSAFAEATHNSLSYAHTLGSKLILFEGRLIDLLSTIHREVRQSNTLNSVHVRAERCLKTSRELSKILLGEQTFLANRCRSYLSNIQMLVSGISMSQSFRNQTYVGKMKYRKRTVLKINHRLETFRTCIFATWKPLGMQGGPSDIAMQMIEEGKLTAAKIMLELAKFEGMTNSDLRRINDTLTKFEDRAQPDLHHINNTLTRQSLSVQRQIQYMQWQIYGTWLVVVVVAALFFGLFVCLWNWKGPEKKPNEPPTEDHGLQTQAGAVSAGSQKPAKGITKLPLLNEYKVGFISSASHKWDSERR